MPTPQEHAPEIPINRRKGQGQGFEEALGEGVSLRMMPIPGGRFGMGAPDSELERREREGPQHFVTVPPFVMGMYPVTQAQWRAIARLEPVNRLLSPDPSHFKGDRFPVESVTWDEAMECCERLTRHTGRDYRLPSEAEWEYACRAGTATPFYFGETITTELANYRGTDDQRLGWSGAYGQGPRGLYREETTPVDHFDVANAFGLCDMHGNVFEWCLDHVHESYDGAPEEGSAWWTDDERAPRIIRGGSWYYFPRACRSAYRYSHPPDARDSNIGFRMVCGSEDFGF